MDSILWEEESNNYTRRGSQNGQLDLYREKANRRWMVNEFLKVINELMPSPESILDVGCGYGGTIKELFNQYPSTKFIGIDPGTESIAIAKENIDGKNVELKVGCSHQLDFPEETFDIVNLCMVLQWIPRKYLIRTMAEVDRVLKFGGLIYLNEFLPDVWRRRMLADSSKLDEKELVLAKQLSASKQLLNVIKNNYERNSIIRASEIYV